MPTPFALAVPIWSAPTWLVIVEVLPGIRASAEGIVNEAVKLPVELEVTVLGVVICLAESNVMVTVVELANPVPMTVTEEPTLPVVELKRTEGIIVKLTAGADLEAESETITL